MQLTILDPDSLRDNHVYRIEFFDSTAYHTNANPWYRLIDRTSSDTIVNLTKLLTSQVQTPVVKGFVATIMNDPAVAVNTAKTGWKTGSSNLVSQVGFDSRFAPAYQARRINYPSDFEIRFTAPEKGDTSFPVRASAMAVRLISS